MEYGKLAARIYYSGELSSIEVVFEKEVLYWTEKNLLSLPNSVISVTRDTDVNGSVPIQKRPGPRMCAAPAKYTKGIKHNIMLSESRNSDECSIK